jgi:chaperonin GroEL
MSVINPTQKPEVKFPPEVWRSFQRGAHRIVDAVSPTLGPRPRYVAIQPTHRTDTPELLDDAGQIARRIIQIADRDEDIGAMFVRQMLWRLREEVGDGAATAAVLFKAVYDESIKYIVAGGNALRVRVGLEKALAVALGVLDQQIQHLNDKTDIKHFARSLCPDDSVTELLGEIFDIIGADGHLIVQLGRGKISEREYIEGHLWSGGLLTRNLMLEPVRQRSRLQNAAILITDLEIESASQLTPALRTALQNHETNLVLVARKLSEEATALLTKINRDSKEMRVTAVKAPGTGMADQSVALEDLSALTGGRVILQAAGQTFENITPECFGHARRVWADMERFVIVNGKGEPRALRSHIRSLRHAIQHADTPEQRNKLRERIGRLQGGAAVLSIGGATETEMKTRRDVAERTALILRSALREGVVNGGGIALLDCRAALESFSKKLSDEDEQAGFRALAKALDAPARLILMNSGFDPSSLLTQLGHGRGADARTGQLVDMSTAGILDSVASVRGALISAVRSAALASTVDVVIHKRNPQVSVNP